MEVFQVCKYVSMQVWKYATKKQTRVQGGAGECKGMEGDVKGMQCCANGCRGGAIRCRGMQGDGGGARAMLSLHPLASSCIPLHPASCIQGRLWQTMADHSRPKHSDVRVAISISDAFVISSTYFARIVDISSPLLAAVVSFSPSFFLKSLHILWLRFCSFSSQ